MKKRWIISLLLILCMLLAMLPVTALAAANTYNEDFTIWFNPSSVAGRDGMLSWDNRSGVSAPVEGISVSGNTITLSNFHFTTSAPDALVVRGSQPVTIVLEGKNSITTTGTDRESPVGTIKDSRCIVVEAPLIFTGTGTLDIKSADNMDEGNSYGISGKDFAVSILGWCNITATAGTALRNSFGVDVGSLEIKGGVLTANSSDAYCSIGFRAYNGLSMDHGAQLTGTTGEAVWTDSNGVCIEGAVNLKGGSKLTGNADLSNRHVYGIRLFDGITISEQSVVTGFAGSAWQYGYGVDIHGDAILEGKSQLIGGSENSYTDNNYGVRVSGNLSVKDESCVKGTGGVVVNTNDSSSCGICVNGNLSVPDSGVVEGIGGKAKFSYGVRVEGPSGISAGERATITGQHSGTDPISKDIISSVKMPEFSLPGGEYTASEYAVEISCSTEGADIYYTTDNTEPSKTNGTLYQGPIPLNSAMTIKAVAVKEGMLDSVVAQADYTVVDPVTGGYKLAVRFIGGDTDGIDEPDVGTDDDASMTILDSEAEQGSVLLHNGDFHRIKSDETVKFSIWGGNVPSPYSLQGLYLLKEGETLPAGQAYAVSSLFTKTDLIGDVYQFAMPEQDAVVWAVYRDDGVSDAAPYILTDTLANGTVGVDYSETILAAGGTNLAWSISKGALPGGLTLSEQGTISGTPTTAGTFTFTVCAANEVDVVDSRSRPTGEKTIVKGEKELTITIGGGDTPSPHTHEWAAAWTNDETHHWHECTAENCDITEDSLKNGYGAHTYDDASDTTCNGCGYVREVTPPAPDTTPPTGEIKIGQNGWKQFLKAITFGLFFQDTQEVTITATDDSGQTVAIAYYFYRGDAALTENAVKSLDASQWTKYTGKFSIQPDDKLVIYARLTDAAGNAAYIQTDGVILDATVPIFSLTDGATYTTAQTLTVSDNYALVSVKLDGTELLQPGFAGTQTTISLHTNGTYTITAQDKAGNTAALSVTIEIPAPPTPHSHAWAAGWNHNDSYHWHECEAAGCNITEDSLKNGYGAHTYDDASDTTCNGCGYVRTVTPPAHAHSYSGWSSDETNHWHECTDAGCPDKAGSKKDVDTHTASDWITTLEPTETESGSQKKKCTVCERELETKEIPPVTPSHTHNLTYLTAKAATCGEAGYEAHWYCAGCGKYFSDQEAGTELDYDADILIDATGQHTGGTATCQSQAECGVCGQSYGGFDLDNHDGGTEVRGTKAATEAENGYTGDTWCLGCDTKIVNGTVIPATGHTHSWLGAWESNETHHWHECRNADCPVADDTQKKGYGEHSDSNKDNECDVCGYALPVPAPDDVTLRIPFSKIVQQGGRTTPPAEIFRFAVKTGIASDYVWEVFEISGGSLATDGAGSYEGEVVIRVSFEEAMRYLADGLYLSEVSGSSDGWTYDKTVWRIVPEFDDSGRAVSCWIEKVTEPGEPGEEADEIAFTNIYTKDETPRPTTDPSGDPASTPTSTPTTPATGDTGNPTLWVALLLLASGGLTGTLLYSRKRRKTK